MGNQGLVPALDQGDNRPIAWLTRILHGIHFEGMKIQLFALSLLFIAPWPTLAAPPDADAFCSSTPAEDREREQAYAIADNVDHANN